MHRSFRSQGWITATNNEIDLNQITMSGAWNPGRSHLVEGGKPISQLRAPKRTRLTTFSVATVVHIHTSRCSRGTPVRDATWRNFKSRFSSSRCRQGSSKSYSCSASIAAADPFRLRSACMATWSSVWCSGRNVPLAWSFQIFAIKFPNMDFRSEWSANCSLHCNSTAQTRVSGWSSEGSILIIASENWGIWSRSSEAACTTGGRLLQKQDYMVQTSECGRTTARGVKIRSIRLIG